MDPQQERYRNQLDKAREALISSRREDPSYHDSEHKKKKKHKDERPSRSHSRSRDKKKKDKDKDRDRSRDEKQHKHKKHKHKDQKEKKHRDEHDRKYHDEPSDFREKRSRDDYDRSRDRRDYGRGRDYDRGDRDRNRNRYNDKDKGYGRDYQRSPIKVDEKDPYYEVRRDIEKVRRSDPAKAEDMEIQLQKQILFDKKEKELTQAKEKFKEAQKQMEEAKREDMTVLVYCLPLKAKEKDIWNFFIKNSSGKIRDIRIIRDARSGRSKGVAYVEFYNAESVQRALTMSDMPFELKGRHFGGLRVQHSQAEKNRAAAVAKQMRVIKPADPIEQQQEQIRRQTKVVVSGLTDKLADISESDLKDLFEPFGQIDYVDIHRDPQTGVCKGYAFIQYSDPQKGKQAVRGMNNLQVTRGQKISVQIITMTQKGEVTAGGQFIHSVEKKDNLMKNLKESFGGTTGPSYSNLMRPPISTVTTPYLIITSMFKMQGTTPMYFDNLKKNIQEACDEFGVVERIFIEKNDQGNIWIKYSDTESAKKAQAALNGKPFDGKKIFMYFVTENTYQTRVGI